MLHACEGVSEINVAGSFVPGPTREDAKWPRPFRYADRVRHDLVVLGVDPLFYPDLERRDLVPRHMKSSGEGVGKSGVFVEAGELVNRIHAHRACQPKNVFSEMRGPVIVSSVPTAQRSFPPHAAKPSTLLSGLLKADSSAQREAWPAGLSGSMLSMQKDGSRVIA